MLVAAGCSGDADSAAPAPARGKAEPAARPGPYPDSTPLPEPGPAPATGTEADPSAGSAGEVYAEDAAWICRPGREDVCAQSLDITMVSADGSTEVVEVAHASDPPIDCFYVYPTVSRDETPNSDLLPGESEEIAVTLSEAARFGAVCSVYAPVYRQITIRGPVRASAEIAYGDVRDAFRHYLANDSAGRGFVLIGHSQGAALLSQLIREEIVEVPALRERLVSALLVGPPGEQLPELALCTKQGQVGCLLSYAAYDAASPPDLPTCPSSPCFVPFGWSPTGPAPCTNPAALEGGSAPLRPAFVFGELTFFGRAGGIPFADSAAAPEITTAWVGYPDFVTGECVDDGATGYLSVTINIDPTDPRTDDITRCACEDFFGDQYPPIPPGWGLHHLDMNLALDDLVAVVAAQTQAYAE